MAAYAPRKTLNRRIEKLLDDILVLGSIVEQAVLQAVETLKKCDTEAALRIYASDIRVNEKHYQIEQDCLISIATQQPLAIDLRMLASILKISTELERIGDYAKGIARTTMQTSRHPAIIFPEELVKMALCSADMLQRALSAFIEMDEAAARTIPDMDAEVDAYYNWINRSLMEMIRQNPAIINRATNLMWASHNLERMADRVTNICERTVFVATGKLIELDVSERELSIY